MLVGVDRFWKKPPVTFSRFLQPLSGMMQQGSTLRIIHPFGHACRLSLLWVLGLVCTFQVARAQSYSFAQYEVENGLVQSSVNHFMQDHFGNLWIATAGGLSRFDGHTFTNYYVQDGLAGNNLLFLFENSRQEVMIGSNMGLTVYNGDTFHTYQPRDSSGAVMSVRHIWEDTAGQVHLLMEFNTMATFTGDSIIFTESDQAFNEEISGQYIKRLLQDDQGLLWLCTYQGGVYQWDYQTITPLLEPQEEPLYHFSDLLLEDQTLWLLDLRRIVRYDLPTGQMERLTLEVPDFERTFSLARDNRGMLWVGTTSGAFSFDPLTRQVDPKSLALTGSTIHTIYKDREGNMWFGSFGDGIYKFKGRLFTKLRKEEGLKVKTIMGLTRDSRGDLWLGSYGSGVDRYRQGKIDHFGISEGLSSEFVSCVVEDSVGQIWLGTLYGLNRFDGKKFTNYYVEDGLPASMVYTALRDSQNRLWFGTYRGAIRYEKGRFQPLYDEKDSLFKAAVTSMIELPDGDLIFVAEQEVYRYHEGKVRLLLPARLFQNEAVTAVVLDKNNHLLFSTMNGLLYHYDTETRDFYLLNKKNKIPQIMIYSMVYAEDQSLLIGTQRGIFRFFFHADGEIDEVVQYGKNEGFLGVEANANAIHKEPDGSIWFGTVNGAYKFNPGEVEHNKDEVPTHLTGVRLFYETVDWTQFTDSVSQWYDIPQNLSLQYDNNHLVFTFKAISFTNHDAVQYRFMLENFDTGWSPETDRTEAVYANIPPGTYTFKVKAKNYNGVWSETPTTFSFVILPPFWQTWWFYVLLLTGLTILIRLYILWKLRQERQQRLHLEKVVLSRTSEIKALNDSLEIRVKERTAELEFSNKKFEVEFNLRKLDQERLARQEKEYRMLVNNLREVIFRTDFNGNLTFLNHRWQEYTGYTLKEALGTHFTQYLHFEEKKKQLRAFYALMKEEIPYFEVELRVHRKDGYSFWAKVSARPEYDEEGNLIGTYGSLVDVDQRKRAEFALKGSEEKYKFLAENTQDIITLHDPDLKYVYVSPRIREVAGHEPQDLLGKRSLDFLHPDDQEIYLTFRNEVIQEKVNKGRILRFRNKDGEYHYYETFLKPILDEYGRLKNFISSSRDVTEKVILSKEIEKVRKKVAQDFHDEMGNNLASISVLSQIIQTKLGNQKNGIEALLTKIDTAAKNLFHGTRDFIWAIDPKNDNLKEVYFNLKDFGEDLFDNTGINFYASYESEEEDENLKLPSGWSRQIVLIYKEALTNSLKYSRASHVCMDFRLKMESFQIALSDDGIGFTVMPDRAHYRGLQNMEDRASKINVCLTIASKVQNGTQILLQGKITQNGVLKY